MEDKINNLIKDIRKKAEAESHYYRGAVESLTLLINILKEEETYEEPPKEDSQSSGV